MRGSQSFSIELNPVGEAGLNDIVLLQLRTSAVRELSDVIHVRDNTFAMQKTSDEFEVIARCAHGYSQGFDVTAASCITP